MLIGDRKAGEEFNIPGGTELGRLAMTSDEKCGRTITRILLLVILTGSIAEATEEAGAYVAPRHVEVLPVFLVPTDEDPPSLDQQTRLMRHLVWAQQRFYELLKGRDTFVIAPNEPVIIEGKYSGPAYDAMPEMAGPQFISEVLSALHFTRFNAPYVFFIVVMNTRNINPIGGGRPLNGGLNTGPGMVEISSWALDKTPNFQSTVRHELAHSFGLVHADVYGYQMDGSASIMAYNIMHHTDGFNPSATPGILIPEDIRALALNRRVFPQLFFDLDEDVPSGYSLAPIRYFGPQEIPGQPSYHISGTTTSGEEYGSSVRRMLDLDVKPNWGWTPGGWLSRDVSTYDASSMWHSGESSDGWVSLDLSFPITVTLSGICVHSQHSARYHMACGIRLQAQSHGRFGDVAVGPITSPDAMVEFPPTTAKMWRLYLQAGDSRMVVVRGLRFFNGDEEIFPRAIPCPGQDRVQQSLGAETGSARHIARRARHDRYPLSNP